MLGSILAGIGQIGMSVLPDVVGGLVNSSMQQASDSKAYKRQVKLMKMQQSYNTKMANTAHQRQVKDLRKAGLNPILSATGGNGATTPVTTAPSVSQGSRQDFFEFGSFLDDLKTGAEIGVVENSGKKIKADSDVAKATVKKINAETAGVNLENEIKSKALKGPRTIEKVVNEISKGDFWGDIGNLLEDFADKMFSQNSAIASKEHEKRVRDELHRNSQDALFKEAMKNHPGFEVAKKGEVIYSHPKKKIEYNKIRMRSNEALEREFKKLKRRKK